MRTWRNLSDRAKLTSVLAANVLTRATILAMMSTMLVSSRPSGFLKKFVEEYTKFMLYDASGIFLEVSAGPINRDVHRSES
ncbi:hypothetical protein TNCV_1820691 [Trichonephila clavipes]|nr:hypothetical protein TNCV_1820691 [Trichonephila clavipes]